MLHKIDHVGIAVTNLDAAIATYEALGLTLSGSGNGPITAG